MVKKNLKILQVTILIILIQPVQMQIIIIIIILFYFCISGWQWVDWNQFPGPNDLFYSLRDARNQGYSPDFTTS